MGVYSNYVVTESGIYSPSAMNAGGSALDLMIECAQDDMKMFDSVIELDFMHAYAEAGMVSITEADDENAEKSIGKKIKELFEKIKKKVKDFIATFMAKIQNLFKNDANLYKEYYKDFNYADGVKIDGYRAIRPLSQVMTNYNVQSSKISDSFGKILSSIESANDSSAIDKALDDLNESKEMKRLKDLINADYIFFSADSKKDDYVLSGNDIHAILDVMGRGGKKVTDLIKSMGKCLEKSIDTVKRNTKVEKYNAGYEKDDKKASLMIEQANAKYKVCNKYASVASKFVSSTCNMCARYVSMARKAFIAGAKKAENRPEAKGESALDNDTYAYVLGEASEIYVESALSMV